MTAQPIIQTKPAPTTQPLDYESLFRALPDPYIVFATDDPDFTILQESEAHAALSMVRREDVIGKPVLKAYPDMSEKFRKTGVSDLLESIRKVIATGQPDDMSTLRYDLKDKHGMFIEKYFSVAHLPLLDADGRVLAVIQTATDVTTTIVSGQKLRQTERQLAEALDIARVGTWIWDLATNKITVDKNLSRMFGLSADECAKGLTPKAFISVIHPDDRQRMKAEIDKAISHKSLFDTEYRTLDKNGEVHWLLARGSIETDASNKPVRFPNVLLDITERKQAEATRNFLVEASTALTVSLDYDTTLKSIAKLAVSEIADWCVVDIIYDGVVNQVALAHKDPKKVTWASKLRQKLATNDLASDTAIAGVLARGQPLFVPVIDEALIRELAPSPGWLKLAIELKVTAMIVVPLVSGKDVIGSISLILSGSNRHYAKSDLSMAVELANHASLAIANARLYDKTKTELAMRVTLQEQLRTANDELEQRVLDRTKKLEESIADLNRSNQELQDFAYVASHDLQEPLRKIQAFGNLLEQEYADKLDDGADYLHRMQKAAARMSSLISDLLSLSRVTTKAQDLGPVNLKTVALEVVEDLYARITETHGMVQIGNLPTIDADPLQMRQLLQNMIGNALKFHKPGEAPQVLVSAKTISKAGAQYVKLSVADNGVGFEQKYTDRIFAVFQRLHGRDAYEGTGIGLAVCRKIVDRHHGVITAKSSPGQGSTFTACLPVVHQHAVQ